MSQIVVTRRLEIDAGHRLMTHGSKCRNLHGHRYAIEATVSSQDAALHQSGEQTGMVLDFGFLKEEMMTVIDDGCDHGFICCVDDLEVLTMFAPPDLPFADWEQSLRTAVARDGYWAGRQTRLQSKLYVVPFQPTAEELARHWFHRLKDRVQDRSQGLARIRRLRVYETPNCYADYSDDLNRQI